MYLYHHNLLSSRFCKLFLSSNHIHHYETWLASQYRPHFCKININPLTSGTFLLFWVIFYIQTVHRIFWLRIWAYHGKYCCSETLEAWVFWKRHSDVDIILCSAIIMRFLQSLENLLLWKEVTLGHNYWWISWPTMAYFGIYNHWKSQQAQNFSGRLEWLRT